MSQKLLVVKFREVVRHNWLVAFLRKAPDRRAFVVLLAEHIRCRLQGGRRKVQFQK